MPMLIARTYRRHEHAKNEDFPQNLNFEVRLKVRISAKMTLKGPFFADKIGLKADFGQIWSFRTGLGGGGLNWLVTRVWEEILPPSASRLRRLAGKLKNE